MLEVRRLTVGHAGAPALLNDWDYSFEPGCITAITGASGSGKSSLLYALGLMLRPLGGDVVIDGNPAWSQRDSTRAATRAHVFGFVFQDAALDPTRTVVDNVIEAALYRDEARASSVAKALDLLQRFGVESRAFARPGQISGGQAQRIALCRALLHSPAIILADEPTGNLDRNSAAFVLQSLREEAHRGATVVLVTHSSEAVSFAQHVVELNAGQPGVLRR